MYPDNEELFLNHTITRRKLGQSELKPGEDGSEKPADSANVGTAHDPSEVDTPPRVLMAFTPPYPKEAKTDNIEGRVVLRFMVDTDGKAKEPEVVRFEPEEAAIFVESAMETIEKYNFKPATLNGMIVPCIAKLPVVFELD